MVGAPVRDNCRRNHVIVPLRNSIVNCDTLDFEATTLQTDEQDRTRHESTHQRKNNTQCSTRRPCPHCVWLLPPTRGGGPETRRRGERQLRPRVQLLNGFAERLCCKPSFAIPHPNHEMSPLASSATHVHPLPHSARGQGQVGGGGCHLSGTSTQQGEEFILDLEAVRSHEFELRIVDI